jgi:hypothetical protein
MTAHERRSVPSGAEAVPCAADPCPKSAQLDNAQPKGSRVASSGLATSFGCSPPAALGYRREA